MEWQHTNYSTSLHSGILKYTEILYLHAVQPLTHSPQNNMLNEFKIKYRIFLSEVNLIQFLL
jgi:hypothetical protein